MSHYFLAVPLPDTIQAFLYKRGETLQSNYAFKSWVTRGDYHITLVFLGRIDSTYIEYFQKEMASVIRRHPMFRMTIDGLDVFGKSDQPRVLWNDVIVDDGLYDLQRDLHEKCTELGFDLDRRPYRPHITLARKWDSQTYFEHDDIENEYGDGPDWLVDEVVLYHSRPGQLPRYKPISTFPLQD
ncbi:MAG TPA: RNA 2',3'-cyclic phosphodiesterase [Bacillota bacterium]|nr:RNA 2',3'-cyclic phosphodiesterase [Bacillota bacterium]